MQTPPAPPVEIFVDTRGAKIMEDEASHPDQRDSRDIYLPNHIEAVSHIAVDVGGSLAKVVYFTRSRSSSDASKAWGDQSPTMPSSPLFASSKTLANSISPKPSRSNFHSRQSSMNGSQYPRTPPTYGYEGSNSIHPIPSGTLTPTAILSTPPTVSAIHSTLLKRRSLPAALPGGRLNFIKFETGDIESCVSFLQELIERSARANGVSIDDMRKGVKLMATGGGAHLFYDLFERELGVEVYREDEMGCLITGLNFITLIPDEVFWYSDELVAALHSPLPQSPEARADAQAARSSIPLQHPLPRPSPNPPLYAPLFDSHPSPKLPCLLVNIGSGVSIIKVDDYGKFERVSGTSLGGGTLWGLLSLLTDAESFDEMLELSEQGDNSTVDMMVGDIYGSIGLNHLGLKSSTIASSFGKVFRKDSKAQGREGRKRKFRPEDICKSLLYAISNNIGQIAYMNAEKFNLDRIYFGGCFIRGHQATISTLSYAIRFWSKGTKRAFFLRHEGYLGAIGAWIKHVGVEPPAIPAPSTSTNAQPVEEGLPNPDTSTTLHLGNVGSGWSGGLGVSGTTGGDHALSPIDEKPTNPVGLEEEEEEKRRLSRTPTTSNPLNSNLPPLLAEALGSATVAPGPGDSSQCLMNGNANKATLSALPNGTTLKEVSLRDRASVAVGTTNEDVGYVEEGVGTQGLQEGKGAGGPRQVEASGSDEAEEDELIDPTLELEALMQSLSPADRRTLGPLLAAGAEAGSKATRSGEIGEGDEFSISELLKRMDDANQAADGIEGRLDQLLERLDGMLGACEVDGDAGSAKAFVGR
ncbi:fumble-domain-containing protein [Violaceomyces palustris]|uniref:Fumble-domain-containing protein n=1 Tax=Violaceomyces palustris TaxID=1673888 RepID=A0ACD0P4R3_9BASI|nr:fumble-domain-containing protein [Violaceomyces palustris]